MKTLDAAMLWTPEGWRVDAGLAVDEHGRIAALEPAEPTGSARWMLPGVANLHSHAFQRAMAGLAERQTHAEDSFWTWREAMYRAAARFDPETLQAVAAQLYAEMLEAGYTTVCEFHYLHHAPDGRPYAEPAAMSLALVAAAREAGIRLTLLPVLYMTGGFDGRPLSERQRRFGHDVDAYLRLVETLCGQVGPGLHVGCALHSLRAVPPGAMQAVLEALPAATPVHIHIAEQVAEVQDCLAVRGARPVEWLLANAAVDARWTLVHATHLTEAETLALARSGVTVAICPTTEANLGDGLFPLRAYLDAGGRWGIGSDSHISVSPVEELRWLEYGQRLLTRRRNVAVSAAVPSVGETLLRGVAESAARASGHRIGRFARGEYADAVVLDADAPQLFGLGAQDALDRWIFSGNRNLVREVYVGGRQVVKEGRHVAADAIAARYRQALARLWA
ncbi:formimidoylglutamate deiminase [Vulcaniibacterium tengchongense]|uniref:Formimidoylglutamate deiminase n=1 Tax=Vulcaniibacterium tengchongense TaxID=1273429 RepID=A0A3N4V446_9GAMM|nr:formimidoylglutamate deiminase [Vulcaniibacterium tengchongense]RPE77268.1 formimidoylglutamate deiminase [Vulcaniibacterium tengchongense]